MSVRLFGFEAVYALGYALNANEVGQAIARLVATVAVAVLMVPIADTIFSRVPMLSTGVGPAVVPLGIALLAFDYRRAAILEHHQQELRSIRTSHRLLFVAYVLLGILGTAFSYRSGVSVMIGVTAAFALFPLHLVLRAMEKDSKPRK